MKSSKENNSKLPEKINIPLKEMANLSTNITGLSTGVIYISNKQGKHGARVKYYREKPGKSKSASISISRPPEIIIDAIGLTGKEKRELLKFVELNFEILMQYWNEGETMLIDDVLNKISKI